MDPQRMFCLICYEISDQEGNEELVKVVAFREKITDLTRRG
jgi:hypothetical protein